MSSVSGKIVFSPIFSPISQFSGVWCKYWTIWEIRIDRMRYGIQKKSGLWDARSDELDGFNGWMRDVVIL